LALNYLPDLESLETDPSMKAEILSYGDKLSLGYDNQQLVGEPDTGYWTEIAWEFKHIAYGEEHPS